MIEKRGNWCQVHYTLHAHKFRLLLPGSHWGSARWWWLSYFPLLFTGNYVPGAKGIFFSLFFQRIFSIPFLCTNLDEWQVNYFFCACFYKDRQGFVPFLLLLFPSLLSSNCWVSSELSSIILKILSLKGYT